MIVLRHNHDQLIIGADTRKIALLIVGGFILLCLGIFVLLNTSTLFDKDAAVLVSIGLIFFLSFFVSYYFYHVFGTIAYKFDKRAKTLVKESSNILGTKKESYPLEHILKVESKRMPTFSYASSLETHAYNTYFKQNHHDFYTIVVLKIARKKEINLTPNAAYFFLHPFDALNSEIDSNMGITIAAFLGVPYDKSK